MQPPAIEPPTVANPPLRWRRTVIGGDVLPNDWSLRDGDGKQAARIRKEGGGPQDGRWHWSIQVGPDGRPRNGGTGYADTGAEAKRECEARAGAMRAMLPVGDRGAANGQ